MGLPFHAKQHQKMVRWVKERGLTGSNTEIFRRKRPDDLAARAVKIVGDEKPWVRIWSRVLGKVVGDEEG